MRILTRQTESCKKVSGLKGILRARLLAYKAGKDVAIVGYVMDSQCVNCRRMGIECASCVEKKGFVLK